MSISSGTSNFLEGFNFESVLVCYICLYLNSYVPVKSLLIFKGLFLCKYCFSKCKFYSKFQRSIFNLVKCFPKTKQQKSRKVYLKCHFRIVVPLSAAVLLCHLLLSAKLTFYVNSTPLVM